jgi:hypothetical protein
VRNEHFFRPKNVKIATFAICSAPVRCYDIVVDLGLKLPKSWFGASRQTVGSGMPLAKRLKMTAIGCG